MDENSEQSAAPDGKKIKVEGTTPSWMNPQEENPDEINLDSSDDDEEDVEPKVKKAKKEEEPKAEEEEDPEDEELNDWKDATLDPQLIDLDPYEVQEARAANDMGSY